MGFSRRIAACNCAAALALAVAAASSPAASDQAIIDPAAQSSARIAVTGDAVVDGLAGAGDVNGDGRNDMIAGYQAFEHDESGQITHFESAASVVFGGPGGAGIDLRSPGNRGLVVPVLDGPGLPPEVDRAGDVNGDGLADVLVSLPRTNRPAETVLVVFGRRESGTIDPSQPGGFRIHDSAAGSDGGFFSLGPAGDVNGDGLADVVVGAPRNDPEGRMDAGSVFVVFGKPDTAEVDVRNLGSAGFRIDGAEPAHVSGYGVDGAGDVNQDGVSDVVIASLQGPAWLVFGKGGSATVDLASPSGSGYPIGRTGNFISSAAGAGDVNGDGRPDVVLGAPLAAGSAGSAHAIFGQAGVQPISIEDPGPWGFSMVGGVQPCSRCTHREELGYSLDGAGDLNGDRRADMVVNTLASTESEYALIAFGKRGSERILATEPGSEAFRIDGGSPTAGGGDINGDEIADLLTVGREAIFAIYGGRRYVGGQDGVCPVGGTAGFDISLDGGGGNDCIGGGDGFDTVSGGSGDDLLDGGGGTDTLSGGTGGDTIRGGPDRDFMTGDPGDDTLDGQEGSNVIDGGIGNDRIRGGDPADSLNGGSDEDAIHGGDGDDGITGASGRDTLHGEDGDDRIEGGLGRDVISGGPGGDNIVAIDGQRDVVRCGTGHDVVRADGGDRVASDCERVIARSGAFPGPNGRERDDEPPVAGGNLLSGDGEPRCELRGGPAGDTIDSPVSGDCLFGLGGPDLLAAGSGDDLADGGDDTDVVSGGPGNDGLAGAAARDFLGGGPGRDALAGGAGSDIANGAQGNDTIDGGEAGDSLNGGSDEDEMRGGDGGDGITGASGRDVLYGQDGDDRIEGGLGRDEISGGAGGDNIVAADGQVDSIRCGSGRDVVRADREDEVARDCELVIARRGDRYVVVRR